ncbi:hypoxanthine phosphoribosyltransferase [Pseudoflavonifractor sp. An85]|uniref:hypoxanthine phosphoribosyltransferase n=1 Tax=Pseudoflavonifractor sp. An85 TaxID=1965661 RepID=UPI000B3ACD18|nr:hypoxanthine phosphoribosyltransferase [Pseudoflavonifractor sp. An85]OUN24773.1 hypoxanthine phosphoribosyltransferase [Pseudoflavonifractor sp. An85]
MHEHVESILYSEEQLRERVKELGAQITADYAGKEPVLASVLRGSYIFMADLTRAIDLPVTVDFMAVSSYGAGTKSSGQVEIKKDLSDSIEGRDLIIVEDILDSGNTLYYLMEILKARKPASIRICTLMDKPERRTQPIVADYVGFEIPDAFVVGYGLDYAEKYRNLPYVGILKPSVYGGE